MHSNVKDIFQQNRQIKRDLPHSSSVARLPFQWITVLFGYRKPAAEQTLEPSEMKIATTRGVGTRTVQRIKAELSSKNETALSPGALSIRAMFASRAVISILPFP
jgi:hypothetical protein